ncbi:hypothetical protein Gotur_007697 [Gossypium turneri]
MAFPWQPALYIGIFSTELCLWIKGASFAWFLLGERWGTTKWIGVALVLEVKKGIEKGNLVLVSQIDKGKLQKKLSTSPIVVRPRKDPMDVF